MEISRRGATAAWLHLALRCTIARHVVVRRTAPIAALATPTVIARTPALARTARQLRQSHEPKRGAPLAEPPPLVRKEALRVHRHVHRVEEHAHARRRRRRRRERRRSAGDERADEARGRVCDEAGRTGGTRGAVPSGRRQLNALHVIDAVVAVVGTVVVLGRGVRGPTVLDTPWAATVDAACTSGSCEGDDCLQWGNVGEQGR